MSDLVRIATSMATMASLDPQDALDFTEMLREFALSRVARYSVEDEQEVNEVAQRLLDYEEGV